MMEELLPNISQQGWTAGSHSTRMLAISRRVRWNMEKEEQRRLWDEVRLLEFQKWQLEREIERLRAHITPENAAEFAADFKREMEEARNPEMEERARAIQQRRHEQQSP
jgi:hypothetical protein